MKRIIGLVLALLILPSLALADTFALTTASLTMYSGASSRPMGCMNIGAQTAYVSLDGTTATTTNGLILQANGGWANIVSANAGVSGITSTSTTTVVCYPGVQFSAGSTNPASAAAGTFRSFDMGGSNAVVSNSVANFFPVMGADTAVAAASEGDVSLTLPGTATFKNLACQLSTAAGVVTVAGGTNYVVALRKNLATSALTCTIAAAASGCQDTTHTVSVVLNDMVDFIDTPSGTPTALVVDCSVEVDI